MSASKMALDEKQERLDAASTQNSVTGESAHVLDVANRRGRLVVLVVMTLMSVWLLSYAYNYAPVVPVWDGWTWMAHAKGFADGGLAGLMHEHPLIHAQHLYLIPAIIALVLGPLVDYSFRPFAFLCVLLLIACGVTFYRFARARGLGRYEALAVFLVVASMRHYENLLLGFQIGLLMSVLLGCWAIIVADTRRDRRGLVAALALGFAAALSSSGGILALLTIIPVRWFDPERSRKWIVVGAVVATLLVALHFALMASFESSFVADVFNRVTWSAWPVMFQDAVKLAGNPLSGGLSATAIGLLVMGGAIAMILVQARRIGRIDALAGLAIFSLSTTIIIAAARSPFETPDSRHAIFAVPAVAVCAIGLFQLVKAHAIAWVSALALIMTWVNATASVDAQGFQSQIGIFELETRHFLGALVGDGNLTPEEIGRVNPGPTEFIRSLMEYSRDHHLMIFSPNYHGIEVHNGLPTLSHGAAEGKIVDGQLQFSGLGIVYEKVPCPFPSGCSARLSVELSAKGHGEIGFILRGPDGAEKGRVRTPVPASEGFTIRSAIVEAAPGDTLTAFVYSDGPDDIVRVKTFSLVILQASQVP